MRCVLPMFRFRSLISLLRNTIYAFCFSLHFIYFCFPHMYALSCVSPNRRCKLLSQCNDVATCIIIHKFTRLCNFDSLHAILHTSRILANLQFILYSLRQGAHKGRRFWKPRLRKKLRNLFAELFEIMCNNRYHHVTQCVRVFYNYILSHVTSVESFAV